jgi:hypothetical protein
MAATMPLLSAPVEEGGQTVMAATIPLLSAPVEEGGQTVMAATTIGDSLVADIPVGEQPLYNKR